MSSTATVAAEPGPLRSGRYVLIGLLALAGIALVPYLMFYAPVIYEDDWSTTVWLAATNNLVWLDWAAGRPLQLVPRLLLYEAFGINIHAYYLVLFVLNIVTATQIFFLASQILPDAGLLAWTIAALFLVYPADYTRTYLTMISVRLSLSLLLLYAQLTIQYARRRNRWLLVSAILSLMLALWMYEGGLGLVLVWCLILLFIERDTRRWVVFLSTGAVALFFVLWRMLLAPRLNMGAQYLEQFSLSADLLLERWWLGMKVLVWAWAHPIGKALSLKSSVGSALVIAGIVVIAWSIVRLVEHKRGEDSDLRKPGLRGRDGELKRTFFVWCAGFVLATAGFFPIITVFTPNLSSTMSRVNLFASLGAAAVMAAVVWAGAISLARSSLEIRRLMIAGSVPLVVIGMIVQAWVQHDIRAAWEEQKNIWNQLFTICPNLESGSAVYVVLPGYADRFGYSNWQRTPLSAEWEVTDALRVLYGDNSLRGDVVFPDVERREGAPTVTELGMISYWSKEITLFDRTVFVLYDRLSAELSLVTKVDDLFGSFEGSVGYAPQKLCHGGPAPQVELRQLVD